MSNWTMSRRPYKSATSPSSRICSSLQTTSTEIRDCSTAPASSRRWYASRVALLASSGTPAPTHACSTVSTGSGRTKSVSAATAPRSAEASAPRVGSVPAVLRTNSSRSSDAVSARGARKNPSPSPPLAIAGSPSPETGRSTARRRRTGAAPRSRGRGARRSLMSTGKLRLDALERNREVLAESLRQREVVQPAPVEVEVGGLALVEIDRVEPSVRARQSKWNACRSTSPVRRSKSGSKGCVQPSPSIRGGSPGTTSAAK